MKKNNKYLTPQEADKLYKKLTFKYGAEMKALQVKAESDKSIYGYILPETEALRDNLIAKIENENGK